MSNDTPQTERGPLGGAYLILSADALSEASGWVDEMSPASHMPAGYPEGDEREARAAAAAKFTQTEGDEQYDYEYLADEHTPRRTKYLAFDPEGPGQGQHRKWVGELDAAEWRLFADAYLIELDDAGVPVTYNETMGSLTAEYGLIPAISVDLSDGWGDGRGEALDVNLYASFYGEGDAPREPGA